MDETIIKEILKKYKITPLDIKKADNSYNSNVYIIITSRKKYILKIYKNKTKRLNEKNIIIIYIILFLLRKFYIVVRIIILSLILFPILVAEIYMMKNITVLNQMKYLTLEKSWQKYIIVR